MTDPRRWGLEFPGGALLCFAVLSVILIWGNVHVEKGGILDRNVILREDDPARQRQQYVAGKEADGFEGREFVSFILHRDLHTKEDLRSILDCTTSAKKVFGDTILSLASPSSVACCCGGGTANCPLCDFRPAGAAWQCRCPCCGEQW